MKRITMHMMGLAGFWRSVPERIMAVLPAGSFGYANRQKIVRCVNVRRPTLSTARQEPGLWRSARKTGIAFLMTDLCR